MPAIYISDISHLDGGMSSDASISIGLSGGMGCGKSTALSLFRERGIPVFETDAYVRTLLAEDRAVQEEIRANFGQGVINSEGGVDRAHLGSIVFADPSSLETLEKLIHPRVRKAWELEISLRHRCLVVEIPLLFEKNLQSAFEFTCCVVTDPRVQMQRLLTRGWTEQHIAQRLARQWSLDEKARHADVVILNDGDEAHLGAQLDRILRRRGISLPSN